MEAEQFIFRISAYDAAALRPQLSRALELRTELLSRARYPALWRFTDRGRAASRSKKRSRGKTVALSIVCLALGVFLLVPGCMEPQALRGPLIAGAIGVVTGICGLLGSRKKRGKSRYDRAAETLLQGKDRLSPAQAVSVRFTDAGMTAASADGEDALVAYDRFETVIETADAYLIVYDRSALPLQKRDLDGAAEDLSAFLAARTKHFGKLA